MAASFRNPSQPAQHRSQRQAAMYYARRRRHRVPPVMVAATIDIGLDEISVDQVVLPVMARMAVGLRKTSSLQTVLLATATIGVGLAETSSVQNISSVAATIGIGLAETATAQTVLLATATIGVGLNETATAQTVLLATATIGVGLSETASAQAVRLVAATIGVGLSETSSVQGVWTTTATIHVGLSEALTVTAAFSRVFVAVGASQTGIATSSDGKVWTVRTNPSGVAPAAIGTDGNGSYVVGSQSGALVYSHGGTSWSSCTRTGGSSANSFKTIGFGAGVWWAIDVTNGLYTSTDGGVTFVSNGAIGALVGSNGVQYSGYFGGKVILISGAGCYYTDTTFASSTRETNFSSANNALFIALATGGNYMFAREVQTSLSNLGSTVTNFNTGGADITTSNLGGVPYSVAGPDSGGYFIFGATLGKVGFTTTPLVSNAIALASVLPNWPYFSGKVAVAMSPTIAVAGDSISSAVFAWSTDHGDTWTQCTSITGTYTSSFAIVF